VKIRGRMQYGQDNCSHDGDPKTGVSSSEPALGQWPPGCDPRPRCRPGGEGRTTRVKRTPCGLLFLQAMKSHSTDGLVLEALDDVLVEGLRAAGIKTRLTLPSDHPLLKCYATIQRVHPGHFYRCQECGAERIARICPHRRFGTALRPRSWPDKPCGRCARPGFRPPIRFVGGPGSKLFEQLADIPHQTLRLRLKPSNLAGLAQRPHMPGGPARARSQRARRAANSLLGFLMGLTERAKLNHYWAGRPYVTDFPQIAPFLSRQVAKMRIGRPLGSTLDKLVFPARGMDFKGAVRTAANFPGSLEGLNGRALVVGRLFRVENRAGKRLVTLTHMGPARLVVGEELWNNSCKSFGEPKEPDKGHAVESIVIALVEFDGGNLLVREAAWARTNRNGILSLSDYEHMAVEGLISLSCEFFKPQHVHLRFGTHAMLVDFLVASPMGPFVLEVDPSGSARNERRKRQRNERFAKANVPIVSYDPGSEHSDIRYAVPPDMGPWCPQCE
jgi:hypothetical protein